MPGNVPNISRNSYDYSKRYDKVTLQQGVPIPDSDWNEMEDIGRMRDILAELKFWGELILPSDPAVKATTVNTQGYAFTNAGFGSGGTTSDVDCTIVGGWALVDGVLVSTDGADPAGNITYQSDTNNIMGEGTVTEYAGTVLTDTSKNWQSFHDLIPVATVHEGCRVKFLTGVEAGNSFVTTAFTQTTLTIPGSAGVAPGDTYIVKPPEPAQGNLLEDDTYSYRAFLQVWYEDINNVEDPNIENPGIGVESSHRDKLRSVVRLHGISPTTAPAAPITPNKHSFGVRYLDLGLIGTQFDEGLNNGLGLAGGGIFAYTPRQPSDYANRLPLDGTVISVTTFASFSRPWLQTAGWGGVQLTPPFNLDTMLLEVDREIRANTTYPTLGTPGGSSHQAATESGNSLAPTNVTYFLKRNSVGVTNAWTVDDDTNDEGGVIGETLDTFVKPLGARVEARGKWSNLTFDNDVDAANQYFSVGENGHATVEGCRIMAGVMEFNGHDGRVNVLRNSFVDLIASQPKNPNNAGMSIGIDALQNVVVVENCSFTAAATDVLVAIDRTDTGGASGYGATIVFRSCTFDVAEDVELLKDFGTFDKYNLAFYDCRFRRTVTSAKWAIDLDVGSSGSNRIGMYNCQVITIGGLGVRVRGIGVIENLSVTVNGSVDAGLTDPQWGEFSGDVESTSASDHNSSQGLMLRDCSFGGTAIAPSGMVGTKKLVSLLGWCRFENLNIACEGAFPQRGILFVDGPTNQEGATTPIFNGLNIRWDTGPTVVGIQDEGVLDFGSEAVEVTNVQFLGTNSGVAADGRVLVYGTNGTSFKNFSIIRDPSDTETQPWASAFRNCFVDGGIIRNQTTAGVGFAFSGVPFDRCGLRNYRVFAQTTGSFRGIESSGGVLVLMVEGSNSFGPLGERSDVEGNQFFLSGSRSEVAVDLDDGSTASDSTPLRCIKNKFEFDATADIATVVIRQRDVQVVSYIQDNHIEGPANVPTTTPWIDADTSRGIITGNVLESTNANVPVIDTAVGNTIVANNIVAA